MPRLVHATQFKSTQALLGTLCLLLMAPVAASEMDKSLCEYPPVDNAILTDPKVPANRTLLQADEADMSKKNYTRFSGSVIIQREGRRIEADKAEYSHKTENFDAEGKVRYLTSDLEVKAEQATMNLKKNQGALRGTQYRTLTENASGSADEIKIDGPSKLVLDGATYTTCPPGKEAWELSASEITLDKENRQGTTSHVLVKFMGVPFLYLPYLRFPIGDERMSGLLMPTFATSDERGTEISLPFYWNIAPDMDATITAHSMTKRGVMYENEFRYLNENSQGSIELDYLEDDKLLDTDRKRILWQHTAEAGEGWSLDMKYHKVGDNAHLTDFGSNINASSTTHLEQRATLNYNAQSWRLNLLAQDFQTLSGDQPYRKLPQLSLASRFQEPDNRLNFNAQAEWVQFDHTDESKLTAERSHLQPEISLPLRSQAAFFIPKVTGYYTQYTLPEDAPQTDKSPSRSMAISSLDTGLFFERDTSVGDTPLLHTFEPRLFYVYAPYREQADLPVFDSGLTEFSFNSLFRENRFTGIDRVGDTNRLTVALTTRYLHQKSGAELFSASIGRVHYYEDRRVTLPAGTIQTENNSDYVGRLAMRPATHWSLSSDIQWDDNERNTRYSTTRLSYQRDSDHLLSLGHRYRRDELSTAELGFVWRFSPRWRILGAYQYDNLNERPQETVYGINYDSCCWGLRFIAREYYNGTTSGQDMYDNAFYLVLELKGLSSFGGNKQAEGILQQTIPGFTR